LHLLAKYCSISFIMSREVEPGFSTFEVTLPKGVNEDTLALYGLGNALGWNIKERVAFASDLKRGDIPEYMEVTPDDLTDVSRELWGTEVYGENALRFLDEERRDFDKTYYIYTHKAKEDGFITASSDIAYRFRAKADDYDSRLGTYSDRIRSHYGDNLAEQEKLEELVAQMWPRTPFPFEAPSVSRSKEPRWKSEPDTTWWWDVQAGPFSRLRLAHYARVSGIARHALQGAVGKTHDVINVTAGLTTKEEVEAKHVEADVDYVDFEEFREMLKESGLTRHAQSEIRNAINWSLSDQIRTGSKRPWRTGEILVEGAGGWVTRGGNRVPKFEKIAKVSLAHLLDSERRTRNVAPQFEARHKLLDRLIGQTGIKQVLEIAAGLSTRGLDMTSDGSLTYVELDLPNMMADKRKIVADLQGKDKLPKRSNLFFEDGSAIEIEDFLQAARYFNEDEPIVVMNEGLLRYLNFDEKSTYADNVKALLRKFGGVWITSDISLPKVVYKEDDVMAGRRKKISAITGVNVADNLFKDEEDAKQFFEGLGFEVESHSFLEVIDELTSPAKLDMPRDYVEAINSSAVCFVMRLQDE
jgi:O-methyltransferase involved in polyketide biosynthesis